MDGSAFPALKVIVPAVAAAVIAIGGIGYAVHEHNNAQSLENKNEQMTAQLSATHNQLDALNAKVNALATAAEAAKPAPPPAPEVTATASGRRPAAGHRTNPSDARFKKLQSQLDEQGKAIDATRSDLSSARTELSGSIARTHDELVVLEKKGERNYYEFDLQKSKEFKREGPLSMSLRKANTKKAYADLMLIVDDRNVTQKHVNLYQPVMYYQPDTPQPIEIVIQDITKDHIHGYISASKYHRSDLDAMSTANNNPTQGNQAANATPQSAPPQRKKLTVPPDPSDQP